MRPRDRLVIPHHSTRTSFLKSPEFSLMLLIKFLKRIVSRDWEDLQNVSFEKYEVQSTVLPDHFYFYFQFHIELFKNCVCPGA
jgi:hypothetical protein